MSVQYDDSSAPIYRGLADHDAEPGVPIGESCIETYNAMGSTLDAYQGGKQVRAHAWLRGCFESTAASSKRRGSNQAVLDERAANLRCNMRVPWMPNVTHPGDSIQFRRARKAASSDENGGGVAAATAAHSKTSSDRSVLQQHSSNVPSPLRVPMLTPKKVRRAHSNTSVPHTHSATAESKEHHALQRFA